MVLLFAVLVVTPLALLLVNIPHASATHTLLFRVINIFQPLAAALALVSFLLPKGVIASALATGWLLFTGLVATLGLGRLSSSRFTHVEELSINAGLIYLPVGAIWMVFSRLGAMPLGFQEPIVTLTAVHFHYAGFATPIIVGMIGRKLVEVKSSAPTTYRLAAFGVIIGSPLLALGITLSPLIEVIAAILLATCLTILALLTLFAIVPKIEKRSTHGLLVVSALSSIAAMSFASLYAYGEFSANPVIDIPLMVILHGLTNAFGFVLCGLLAWASLMSKL